MLAFGLALAAVPTRVAAENETPDDIANLSLEQLANIQVTSVLRRAERLSEAPASVYVITAEDIRRSGATSLPEALRLAPNLQVARADAVQYAITARGFNSVIENKMLVTIDGRTVYSPLFSGVFWEAQDLRLGDIDRIEVVSGPGGTSWGTNAVNGVINVITRSAHDSQGPVVGGALGTNDGTAGFRYGGAFTNGGHYRVYGRVVGRGHTETADGADVFDSATRTQGGMRADWTHGGRELTLVTDAYRGDVDQVVGRRRLTGVSVLGRWTQELREGRGLRMQVYYDRTGRDQPAAIRDALHTFDVEFQNGFRWFPRNELVWGAGYRYQADRLENDNLAALAFLPPDRDLRYVSAFLEDDVALARNVTLLLGMRFEHNDYTGGEWLPSARVSWTPSEGRLFWSAVSRAVRAPARIDRELFVPGTPPFSVLAGGPDFDSETAVVVELGHREQVTPALSYSLTAFRAEYDRLRSIELGPDGPEFRNGLESTNVGLEGWSSFRIRNRWRITAGGVYLHQRRREGEGSADLGGVASLGNDPVNAWTLRSTTDLPAHFEWDAIVRGVGSLPSPHVPAYVAVDSRLGWNDHGFEFSVTGQNLFDRSHPEWGAETSRAELDRAVYVRVAWRR